MLIGREQIDVAADSFANEFGQRFRVCILNHLADHISLARDSADDGNLVRRSVSRSLLAAMTIAVAPADIRFIDFHFAHEFSPCLIAHGRAEPSAHIPSRMIVGSEWIAVHGAMNLKRASALLGDQHQVRDFEPNLERLLCILENRAADHTEAIRLAVLAEPIERL